jgi:small subunit ribosomal protein S6
MLRNYEIMYIIKPTLDEDSIDAVAKKIDDQLTALKSIVEKTEKRGRKRLAYEVKDFKDGFYVLTYFQADPAALTEFERLLKLNDDVIRHLIIRLEDEALAAAEVAKQAVSIPRPVAAPVAAPAPTQAAAPAAAPAATATATATAPEPEAEAEVEAAPEAEAEAAPVSTPAV